MEKTEQSWGLVKVWQIFGTSIFSKVSGCADMWSLLIDIH